MPNPTQDYIRANYEAFQALLPSIAEVQRGKFALMRDGKITEYFDTARDAYLTGKKLYEDGRFSVQEVITSPADLGYFSHAVPQR